MSSFLEEFDFIWNKIVVPVIKSVAFEVSDEFVNASDFSYSFTDFDEYKQMVIDSFKEKRERLKKVYLPHCDNPLLDVHKLGAILCRTLLLNKPFYFDLKKTSEYIDQKFNDDSDNTKFFVDNLYANYKAAFYVSIGYVYVALLGKYKKNKNVKLYGILNSHKTLFFYPSSDHHESFENSTILALQKNDILDRDFDYLSYAIILYQLEQYNDGICTC